MWTDHKLGNNWSSCGDGISHIYVAQRVTQQWLLLGGISLAPNGGFIFSASGKAATQTSYTPFMESVSAIKTEAVR